MRAAMSARSEPGSSLPHVADSVGQLDEEQRVAAAAIDERGDRAVGRLGAGVARRCRTPAPSTSSMSERAERHLQHERPLDGRRPGEVAVGALRRDEQERQVRQRCAR